jgi:LysM repeat protein
MKHIIGNTLKLILLLTLVIGLLPSALSQQNISVSSKIEQQNGKSYYMHSVQPGQTLYSISKAYKTDLETILINNPEARTGLKVNQILRIPAPFNPHLPAQPRQNTQDEAPITETHDYIYHVAGKNNTFKYIADIYVVPVNLVRMANPQLSDPITEGEYVIVPIAPKSAPLDTKSLANRPDLVPYEIPASRKTEIPAVASVEKPQKKPVVSEQKTSPSSANQNLTASTSTSTVVAQPNITNVAPTRQDAAQVNTVPIIWPAIDYNRHTVKEKETLFSIARVYNIRVSEIRQLNPGLSDTLQPGQVLLLPATASQAINSAAEVTITEQTNRPPAAPTVVEKQENKVTEVADTLTHIVKSGETLYRIAVTYGLPVDEIKRMNPGLNEFIRPGQKILVTKKKITPEYILHEVEYAERPDQLAKRYGLQLIDLQRMNPRMRKKLRAGDQIRIPVATYGSDRRNDYVEQADEQSAYISEKEDQQSFNNTSCDEKYAFRHKTFRVALLVPLFLEGNSNLTISLTSETDIKSLAERKEFTFMGFYEGFVLAADSLARSKGLRLELTVVDVDQDLSKTKQAIEVLSGFRPNLIIGPFYSKPFEHIARYARDNNTLIINPFAQRNEILSGFPNVVKVKPSSDSQLDLVAAAIQQYYPKARVFLYSPGSGKYASQVETLKQKLEQMLPKSVKVSNEDLYQLAVERTSGRRQPVIRRQVTVEGRTFQTDWLQAHRYDSTTFENPVMAIRYSQDSIRMVQRLASKVRDNIVIAYADDNVFAMEFMNKLNQIADTATIRLFGLPHWDRFDNLFPENLLNLRTHFTVQSHVNYHDYFTEKFIHQYRQKYGTEPDQYAYEGFDIAWYFLQALMHFNKSAEECLPVFSTDLLQSNFVFRRNSRGDGFENLYWNTYRLDRYRLTDLPVDNYLINSIR